MLIFRGVNVIAMTPFEKALLGELKGIRVELQKMNKNGPIDIKIEPPVSPVSNSDELVKKLAELKANQRITEGTINTANMNIVYDPLNSR